MHVLGLLSLTVPFKFPSKICDTDADINTIDSTGTLWIDGNNKKA